MIIIAPECGAYLDGGNDRSLWAKKYAGKQVEIIEVEDGPLKSFTVKALDGSVGKVWARELAYV